MDRKINNPVARAYSDSTYSRPTNQYRNIVSKTNSTLNYPKVNLADLDCGNIGAARVTHSTKTQHLPRLFNRRSSSRVSAALAGMLACSVAGPSHADAMTSDATQDWAQESGSASWYAASQHSRRTASGAVYNQNALTAAHPWLPFGAKVRVTRRDTGQSVIVTINDRLPSKRHIIDLSVGAAKQLGMLRQGTTEVELEPG